MLEELLSTGIALQPINGEMIRIVESQEQIATNSLVDNLDEQFLLEQLLEESKPPLPNKEMSTLHYLLSTPFRYPPLAYGSRFGARYEPSIFYASDKVSTALAETAYYRFLFLSGMDSEPPSGRLITEHTVFGAIYGTPRGVALNEPPFAQFSNLLKHPGDYHYCQQLGARMRVLEVKAFQFASARDPDGGLNIGLFSPDALISSQPTSTEQCLCETNRDRAIFSFSLQQKLFAFERNDFCVNGSLPYPSG